MPLDAIPILAVPQGLHSDERSGNAPALLREIAEMLRRFLANGETSAIDLHALPLTPADLEWLREQLGGGEIAITLNAEGESSLNETACPGVWWVTHRNPNGAVDSEFIEVADVPDLVKAHHEDVVIGLDHLELLISDLSKQRAF
ncbi:MAG: hydrogenase expression/formation protein [Hydrogenophilales bacterium CG_4_9_14_3_um_filter_63_34]|nr:MAG: hydrogenase expression/formation protein [Hydrogenophilales bacterium CG_4_10_14_3_um_filter_63_21]PJB05631.1 MAG: hydrogenase expression/formation protein [Hydrogenophilales bacterium CG_4_9_14_3_um_filter_63_34]